MLPTNYSFTNHIFNINTNKKDLALSNLHEFYAIKPNQPIILIDDSASYHRVKRVKAFLQDRNISKQTADCNPIENLW